MKTPLRNMTFSVLVLIQFASGEDNNSSKILDNIYNDLFKSFPAVQRSLIDSAFATVKDQRKDKNLSPASEEPLSDQHSSISVGEPEKDIPDLIHQIDTMRNRRLIHFMNNNPKTK